MSPHRILRCLIPAFLGLLPLAAWSPSMHEAQTRMALSRLPTRLRDLLKHYPDAVLEAPRQAARGRMPLPEDVEVQFHKILRMSQERRTFESIAREMGVLAQQVQLLTDPSGLRGLSRLREEFEAYADTQLTQLVLTDEPYWGVTGPVAPGPKLAELARIKTERLALLDACYDERTGKRLVVWDRLSVPFALLQVSYAQGVHATANLWIQLYRAAGDSWTTH